MSKFPRLMTEEELRTRVGRISASQTCDAEYCSRHAEHVLLAAPDGSKMVMVCGEHKEKLLNGARVPMRFDYLKKEATSVEG